MTDYHAHFWLDNDQIGLSIEPFEAKLLAELIGQVRALLMERAAEVGAGQSFAVELDDEEALIASLESALTPLPPPKDEVIARLLPGGRMDRSDRADASSAEFRRLTEDDLRRTKITDADKALLMLERIESDPTMTLADGQGLLRAINDVRLSLGARLNVEEDTAYPRKIRNELDQALAIYFWAGGLQQELVDAVMTLDLG